MSRTIAVTGGTGFVGRAALRALTGTDTALRALARRPQALSVDQSECEVIAADLESEAALHRLVAGSDTLVHIAGAVAARDAQTFHRINAEATLRLARIAAKAGVRHFVFISSLAAREPELSDYAASKQSAEAGLRGLDTDMTISIVRPPAVYGPGDTATLPLIRQLSGTHGIIPAVRDSRFSLIHVDDLAGAICAVVQNPDRVRGCHELDDGQSGGYSWAQIARLAASVTGLPLRLHFLPRELVAGAARAMQLKSALTGSPDILTPGKVRELYHGDWSAQNNLLQDLGIWQPRTGFAEGFAATLAWYRAHGWLPARAGRTKSTQTRVSGDPRP